MLLLRTFAYRSSCGSVFSFLLRVELLAQRVNHVQFFNNLSNWQSGCCIGLNSQPATQKVLAFSSPCQLLILSFYSSHPGICQVVSHSGSGLHFSDHGEHFLCVLISLTVVSVSCVCWFLWPWWAFLVCVGCSSVFFSEVPMWIFAQFCIGLLVFLLSCERFLYILGTNAFPDTWFANVLSHSLWLISSHFNGFF